MQIINWAALDPKQQQQALARPGLSSNRQLPEQVASIIAAVRIGGDRAMHEYTRRFDGVDLTGLQVPHSELQAALAGLDHNTRRALENAKARIETFHRAQLPQPVTVETAPGVYCETLYRPVERVGLYVPAGSAPLPSTVLMLAVPATIAGCPLKVLVTPPNARGQADPTVLAAAALCGLDAVFLAGGAQAIAALAYGTESIPQVDKIFGPGNAWVTEAKQQVATDPAGAAIDMPAGPSEVLVLADGSVPARFAALDLLSQAEHGPDSQAMLVTDNPALAAEVYNEIHQLIPRLSRCQTIETALQHGRIIIAPDRNTMLAISNAYAPEHLIVQLENPRDALMHITAAGSVFLGPWTPESLGDYCSGTNHVLPTYGHARSHSGLSVTGFLKRITVQEASRNGLQSIGGDALVLAQTEGLTAHEQAVSQRMRWSEDAL